VSGSKIELSPLSRIEELLSKSREKGFDPVLILVNSSFMKDLVNQSGPFNFYAPCKRVFGVSILVQVDLEVEVKVLSDFLGHLREVLE